jgi:hypothetical protein
MQLRRSIEQNGSQVEIYKLRIQSKSFFSPCDTIFSSMSLEYIDYIKARHKIAPYTSRLFSRMLIEADKRMEKHKKFVKRIEDAKTMSIQNFNELPKNATIREEYIKCGKKSCELEHGPYYYAYWKEIVVDDGNEKPVSKVRLRKKYVGTYLPENEANLGTSKL